MAAKQGQVARYHNYLFLSLCGLIVAYAGFLAPGTFEFGALFDRFTIMRGNTAQPRKQGNNPISAYIQWNIILAQQKNTTQPNNMDKENYSRCTAIHRQLWAQR